MDFSRSGAPVVERTEPGFRAEGAGTASGFLSGLAHPFSGLDHVVAMVAVGLWGAQLKKPAIWMLPVAFPVVMAFGGMLGVRGILIPAVEIGIAVSAIVLGGAVLMEARPALWLAAVIVGAFAIFHGHAHGTELPKSANALAYSVGFVLATGCLHATGIAIGLIYKWPTGKWIVRLGGAVIALIGGFFLFKAFSS